MGFPQGGVWYSARAAAAFVSGKRMQLPSETTTVHSASEWHARSECGTFAQTVSSASHRALPVPWAQGTRSIRWPGFRPHTAGGFAVPCALETAATAGGEGNGTAAGGAVSAGAADGTGAEAAGRSLEATAGEVAGGGTRGGEASSQAARATGTSQRDRVASMKAARAR
jgi:hypothetical protein